MSSKYRFKLNSEGVRQLLKSEEMKNALSEYAKMVQNRVGEGYSVSKYTGKTRANASVHAETNEAKRDNLKNNTLLKALGSVKG